MSEQNLGLPEPGSRLSTPSRTAGVHRPLEADERTCLVRVADTLIPARSDDPAPSATPGYDGWLDRAISARAESFDRLMSSVHAMAEVPAEELWAALRTMSGQEPEEFHLLSSVVAGAYLMVPDVMNRIGYPGQQRNPPRPDEAAEYLEDGILDPVIERGPVYRQVQ